MLVDSHCHLNLLNLEKYNGDLKALVQAARDVNVGHILCVGIDFENSKDVIKVAEQFPDVSASVGLHPSEHKDQAVMVDEIIELANHPKVVAIGETGLDYHYNDSGLDTMRERFRLHIRAAHQCKKPLIIHTRAAHEDTIAIMREEKAQDVGGVMHCFTESWEMAQESLELGFYISFSGIVTFKNAKNVVEVARQVPLDKMLIETDAPYLTPVPYRGKPNEPQFVRYVAEKIAELHNTTVANVEQTTTRNFQQLFGVSI